MEEISPYKQIDAVLLFLKERSDLSADFSKQYIRTHIDKQPELKIDTQILEEILQRLIDDGFIKETLNLKTQPTYHLTFNGRIFESYSNKHKSLNEERTWIRNLQVQTLSTSKKLNLVTWIIAFGAIVAAFYYLFEIFK